MKIITTLLALLFYGIPVYAELDTTGKILLQGELLVGLNGKNEKVGEGCRGTILLGECQGSTEAINISAGEGLGVFATIGYGILPKLEVDVSLGQQNSTLSPAVEDASGSFRRDIFLFTAKYKIPLNNTEQLKLGGGIGFYNNAKMDLDFKKINGDRYVVDYENTTGYHLTFDMESLINHNLSWTVGVRYYIVDYTAKKATINNQPAVLTSEKFKTMDGTGLGIGLSLLYYL
ncbi:MAG: hypothetical protein DRQ51_09175 [Gammaproteobacteria bacterium]|nr:MAG: hypothetical protein DRQ51_09175 [Gammaproteobacteria bacterium]